MYHLVEGLGQNTQWSDLLRPAWSGVWMLIGRNFLHTYPDQHWHPTSLMFNGYWGLSPGSAAPRAWCVPLTHLLLRLSINGAKPLLPLFASIGILQGDFYLHICRRNVTMEYDSANWCVGTDVAEEFAAFLYKVVHVCSYIPYTRGL